MSNKKKKFSQFQLPTVPVNELYIVGYEVGTGENGENTSVRIKASDLSFGASGAAGVSSINGLTGPLQIQGSNGITTASDGRTITIKGTNPIIVD